MREVKRPDGTWELCSELEAIAVRVLSTQLADFSSPIRECYEAGVQVATLPSPRSSSLDMRLAALFLKRALTDLRAVWVLVTNGYTSQAASVAAALYEVALAATAIAGFTTRAEEVLLGKTGDLPWKAEQQAKFLAERKRAKSLQVGIAFSDTDYEKTWRAIYSHYKFLCKIKHPTLRSAMHDAHSASAGDGEFVIMAAPDLREEDTPVKSTIIAISISRCAEAIETFADESHCDKKSEEYGDFMGRLSRSYSGAMEAYEKASLQTLPFTIADERIAREYAALHERPLRTQQDT